VRERAWIASSSAALEALEKLEQHAPMKGDYPYAAQLECALHDIGPKLRQQDGRPVILVAGGRSPFPPRNDRSGLLPCPHRIDWRKQLDAIKRNFPKMTIGVIHDQDADDITYWQELGQAALSSSDVVEVWRFAADLGVGGPPAYVPFPLACQD
jgi:hypothetical protein